MINKIEIRKDAIRSMKNRLKLVQEDIEMLQEGTWVPDRDSCEATLGTLREVIWHLNEYQKK
jgi:hypothetical protein